MIERFANADLTRSDQRACRHKKRKSERTLGAGPVLANEQTGGGISS
jgi:hypothetical protein